MIQKPFRGVQLNRTHPLAKGLVGCWLFNEATGETVFDSSGHGNNGTLENGVAWGDGVKFDGVDDYVEISSPIDPNSLWSLSMWFYLAGNYVTEGDYVLIGLGEAGNMLYLNDSPAGLSLFDGSIERIDANTSINEWHHIGLTHYGNGIVDGLIDGNPFPSASSTTFLTSANNWKFGARTTNIKNINGSIGSVSVYNRALSAEEIAWSYREPYAMFRRPIV